MSANGDETLRFAEQVIVLLDQGRQTATYKFAVLLGLMDLCLELTDRFGDPPSHIMTGQLAEKVIALYWPHAQPMDVTSGIVLQQNTGKRARVLQLIDDFRSSASAGRSVTLHAAKLADRDGWETLRAEVEWTLVKMPLPKLQRASGTEDRFIYHIGWDDDVSKSAWRSGAIDSRIHLEPGVARSFVRLAGLLRPCPCCALSARVPRSRCRVSETADPAPGGRRHRHARIDHQPCHDRQIRAHAAGNFRAQVLLQQPHHVLTGRRPCIREREAENQKVYRRGEPQKAPIGPAPVRYARSRGYANRPSHSRQVPRNDEHFTFFKTQEGLLRSL